MPNSMTPHIYKYPLPVDSGPFTITMPQYSRILSVGEQDNHPVMWCCVNTDNPDHERKLRIVYTGEEYPTGHRFIGTILLSHGRLVLHVFDKANHDRTPENH